MVVFEAGTIVTVGGFLVCDLVVVLRLDHTLESGRGPLVPFPGSGGFGCREGSNRWWTSGSNATRLGSVRRVIGWVWVASSWRGDPVVQRANFWRRAPAAADRWNGSRTRVSTIGWTNSRVGGTVIRIGDPCW